MRERLRLAAVTMSFDIRQLGYAITAADHGSFYRAARSLDVEQSTLSRAILKLERAIGMPIFERSRAGVTMTLAGTAFIRGAKPMVATADNLVATMRAAGQGRAGGLRLGHNSSVSAGYLRAALMGWHEANPDVEIECVEGDRSVLFAGLDTGEIDIAILMGSTTHNRFRCEPLWSERMLAALPVSHRFAERDVIHWTDLRGEHFLLPAADGGRRPDAAHQHLLLRVLRGRDDAAHRHQQLRAGVSLLHLLDEGTAGCDGLSRHHRADGPAQ